MRSDEVLVAVEIPRPSATSRTGSYKVSKRREMDISSVASSMYIELSDEGLVTTARFAYGGMAATPARASSAEAAVVGQPWNQDTVRGAMSAMDADFTPLSDHRGSAWYRATVAKNLLLGFFLETREASGVTRLPDHPSSTMVLR
jgi:xanthine dehydrogenase iron-sulfur cluster and FAD-binding subunit A